MKTKGRIVVAAMILLCMLANISYASAKVYHSDENKQYYYTFTGKLKSVTLLDKRAEEFTSYVLILNKKIKVENTWTKKVMKTKKLQLNFSSEDFLERDQLLAQRDGKRVRIRGTIFYSLSCYVAVPWILDNWSFAEIVVSNPETPTNVKLENGVLYKGYDITGDGTPDTIKVSSKYDNHGNNTMGIYINGKKVFTHKEYDGDPEVHLLLLSDNLTLLEVVHWVQPGYRRGWICRYKDSKWETVLDLVKSSKCGWAIGTVEEVTSDSILINYEGLNGMVGASSFKMEYKYSDGKLEEKEKSVDFYIEKIGGSGGYVKKETMTANREMDYIVIERNDNNENNEITYATIDLCKIKPGDRVTFLKIGFTGDTVVDQFSFLIKVGDNLGILEAYEDKGKDYYFKDTVVYG